MDEPFPPMADKNKKRNTLLRPEKACNGSEWTQGKVSRFSHFVWISIKDTNPFTRYFLTKDVAISFEASQKD